MWFNTQDFLFKWWNANVYTFESYLIIYANLSGLWKLHSFCTNHGFYFQLSRPIYCQTQAHAHMAVLCFIILMKKKCISCTGKNTAFFQLRCIQAEKRQLALLLTKHYFVWLMKCWAKYQPLHCCSKNKDPFEREQTFVFVWLLPWRLGSSIIVFRTQTETDQTHRQPTDQNGSCGRGIHHALIRFGFGLVCTD